MVTRRVILYRLAREVCKECINLHLHRFAQTHSMCQEASPCGFGSGSQLAPHESNTLSLMRLDPRADLRVDIDEILVVQLGWIDNDMCRVFAKATPLIVEPCLQFSRPRDLFPYPLPIGFADAFCAFVFDNLALSLLVRGKANKRRSSGQSNSSALVDGIYLRLGHGHHIVLESSLLANTIASQRRLIAL